MGIDARERLLQRAELLASVAEDEKRFGEVVGAWGNGDPEGFVAALRRIPLPDGGEFGSFALVVCEELTDLTLVPVERLVWADSGRLFDSEGSRAALQAQKNAPANSDAAWAAIIEWLIDLGILEIKITYVRDPHYPIPLDCKRTVFGPGAPTPSPWRVA